MALQNLGKLLGTLLLVTACKAGGLPDDAKTTVLSFTELDCAECGESMAKALIAEDGVFKTAFNQRKAELTVVAEPSVDVLALAEKSKPKDEEWSLVAGAGKGAYIGWATPASGLDVKQVANDGEDVLDLKPHLAAGKVTIVDFSAKWCEPCRNLDTAVLKLMENRSGVAYRKLDVGDWDTPLAARYLKGASVLPHVLVFDQAGNQIATVSGFDLPKLEEALSKAAEAK